MTTSRPRRVPHPNATVLIDEVADGGWGTDDNALTRTTPNKHDRTGAHRGSFGSRRARSRRVPNSTR